MVAQRAELTVQSNQHFTFTPRTLEEAEKYASLIANSSICPMAFKGRPGDVLIILQMGNELGLKPMQALRSLGCINGMAFAYGDGLLSLVKRHREFEDIKEWSDGDIKLGTYVAHCTIYRKGQEPQTRSFSYSDAKTANLLGKTVWAQYPKRMLQHRARGYACRDVFPDALFGLYSEDEVQGIPTPAQIPVSQNKGLAGLKDVLNIEPQIIEAEEINTDNTDSVNTLRELLTNYNVKESTIQRALKKFGVESIEGLHYEMIDKWINHLKSKELKNDQVKTND